MMEPNDDEKKSGDPRDDDHDGGGHSNGAPADADVLGKLAAQCQGLDDAELMKRYIESCPFVPKASPVAKAALESIELEMEKRAKEEKAKTDRAEFGAKAKAADTNANLRASLKTVKSLPSSRKWRIAGYTLRTLVLDVPLLLILLVHAGLEWLDHVHQNYLHRQLNAMVFTESRRQAEITYYSRPCDATDITTFNGVDLFLPVDATPDEAFEHHLRHGFTVFRGVLDHDDANELRGYISSKNYNLTEDEKIYVIENENRFSFGLGTEVPIVARAMKKIANHPQLGPSIEKIMGPDPALIEMTAITAKYGAVNQYYHDDVIPTASAIRYGRAFGPSYSVFMVLQNTTKEMGATGVCPGTHYCSDGHLEQLCTKEGYQLLDPDTGYWNAGDALLMNMNSFHRGSAHTDPTGPDRVMLILTFSPKPKSRVESRLMSQGITFSLRWDMWGNTLNDLANSERMVWPFTILRALGLYKLPSASWGIDYITGSSMRMSNQDYGFKPDEFEEFIALGGLKWLPKFLHGNATSEEDSWYEYLQETYYNVAELSKQARHYAIGSYIGLFLFAALFCGRGGRLSFLANAGLRFAFFWLLVSFLHFAAQKYVDESHWAKDILADRRYSGVFKNQSAFGIGMPGPTTFPTRLDVLIENRYGSKRLSLYEEFVNGHPGNRAFNAHVHATASQFVSYPPVLKNATAHFILSRLNQDGGRILYQGAQAGWHWLDNDDALAHIRRELATHSSGLTAALMKTSRRIISEYMYGLHRQTILAQKHAVPYQRELEKRILTAAAARYDEAQGKLLPERKIIQPALVSSSSRRLVIVPSRIESRSRSPFPPLFDPREAHKSIWISSGDEVETYDDSYWYYSTVVSVTAHGKYNVWYPSTSESGRGRPHTVRPFKPFTLNEEVECMAEDENYYPCYVQEVNADGTYTVYVMGDDDDDDSNDYVVEEVPPSRLRRAGKAGDGKGASYRSAYEKKPADGDDSLSQETSQIDEAEDDYYDYDSEDE